MVEHHIIEKAWQKKWASVDLGVSSPDKRKKFFMIFAYPGISGFLHVGHMRGFSYTDATCRYKRMNGYNVLYPVGTHASGNMAFAFLNKIKNNDVDWIDYLKRNGATDADLKKMKSTDAIIDYFNNVYIEQYWKRFGFLCDWDRFTCTSYPDYQRFIQWQFSKLNDAGLLVQKPYYATFCPEDGPVAVDPSQTDISKGGNAEKHEYTLLKFKLNDYYLVAASLRPETVFGQTNLWVNPDTIYCLVEVGMDSGKETWVMSGPAAEKFAYQQPNVKIIGEISGRGFLGQKAVAPGVNRGIIILPAVFCDPDVGSGIVTSVPSDAPYDWIALHDLQKDKALCDSYGLDFEEVRLIKPIPIIRSKGYGANPAIEICQKMGITSQKDTAKLEEATKEIYKAGFHTGIMNDGCGRFAGKRVEEAKELVKAWLISEKKADVFHDLSEEVICRCGKRVVIKRIEDQWFIKYSDSNLTAKAKHCASSMQIMPDMFKANLPGILDWFSDRACTRLGNWIGTKLPFDPKWTIEPIADSTLYPLYYLIAPYFNTKKLKLDQLTNEFFDFVILGKGKVDDVAKKTKVKKSLLLEIQKDVSYFYPLDINLGGKEHQTVHFPVFIMNHVAVLPEKMWPRGIFVNWWVVGDGGKISKSKGGAQPIPGAIEKYGVDGLRLYYAHIGSPHTDVVWSEDTVFNYTSAVDRIYMLITELKKQKGKSKSLIDDWLVSRTHQCVLAASVAFEQYELREAATAIYFGMHDDVKWYLRRGGNNPATLKTVFSLWARLLMPITPHLAEEMWKASGGSKLVSQQEWPTHDEKKIKRDVESSENSMIKLVGDIRTVMKLAKIEKPASVKLIVAPSWKYSLFNVLKKQLGITRDMGAIMKTVMADPTLREAGEHISKIVPAVVRDPSKIPDVISNEKDELKSLRAACEYLSAEFSCKVEAVSSLDSKDPKAGSAMPGKPAVVVQ